MPFNEGITKFDTEFAVSGHKTASDTKIRQFQDAGFFPLSPSQVLTETTVGLGSVVDVAFWVIVF